MMIFPSACLSAISEMMMADKVHKLDQEQIARAKETLSPELFVQYMTMRHEQQIREQHKKDKDRKHRELCEAIRSTSFWRFGG